jgi:uncharacterized protein
MMKIAGLPLEESESMGIFRHLRCEDCGVSQALVCFACATCGSTALVWQQTALTGAVYATTTVYRAPTQAFRARVPYCIVLVDMDRGPRVMGWGEPVLAIGEQVVCQATPFEGGALMTFVRAGNAHD